MEEGGDGGRYRAVATSPLGNLTRDANAHTGLEEMLDDLVLGEEEEVNVGDEAFDEEAEAEDGAAGPAPARSGKKAAAARSNPY